MRLSSKLCFPYGAPSRLTKAVQFIGCLLVAAVLIAIVAPNSWAQDSALPPEQANQLQQVLEVTDPAQFAEQAQAFWQASRNGWDEKVKIDVRLALGARAKQFILEGNALTSLDSQNSKTVLDFATAFLTNAERAELSRRVNARYANAGPLSFDQLKSRIEVAQKLQSTSYADRQRGIVSDAYANKRELRQITADWLAQQELPAVSRPELHWCFDHLCPAVKDVDGFHVVWTGFLTVPRSGPYTFSISPWKVSYEHSEAGQTRAYRQTMTVNVNGQTIVDASPKNWNYQQAAPINLTAGEKIPLRVELRYERNADHKLCPAVLYWSGPGFSKTVVPPTALNFDETGTPGLRADYAGRENVAGQIRPATEQVVDPNIEFVWLYGLTLGARDKIAREVSQEFVKRWSQPDGQFITEIGGRPVVMRRLTSLLSLDQIRSCLQSLLDNPSQIAEYSSEEILRFYEATRCADKQAIDVLGVWMTQHQNDLPLLASNAAEYFELNRKFYYRLSTYLAFEYPPALDDLEKGYLQTSDGNCCLPVAYALAESYSLRESLYYPKKSRIEEWMAKLDERLEDPSVVGDTRINWLIARAQAEEIRFGQADRHAWNVQNLSLGQAWLDEALLTAESEATLSRVKQEVIARLMARGNLDEAKREMDAVSSSSRDPKLTAQMSEWLATAEKFKTAETQGEIAAQKSAQDFYRSRLAALRDEAAQQGNVDAAAQFDGVLSELPSE